MSPASVVCCRASFIGLDDVFGVNVKVSGSYDTAVGPYITWFVSDVNNNIDALL